MKKIFTIIAMLVFLSGCGNRAQKESQGAPEQKADLVAQGLKYLSQSDVPRAIQSFDTAIKSDPTNPDNYLVLGQVYMRLGNFERAIDTFTGAVNVSPQNGEAYFLLATSLALGGDKEGAVKAAQKSVDLFMQNRDEERFKMSLALLRNLVEGDQPPALPSEQAQAPKK